MASAFRERHAGLNDALKPRLRNAVVSDAQFERMQKARSALLEELSSATCRAEIAEFGAVSMMRFLLRENQYVGLRGRTLRVLGLVYDRFLEDCVEVLHGGLSRPAVTDMIFRHHSRLSESLTCELDINSLNPVQPVCGNYSPELQCEILEIDPGQLLEPVIDLGCGQNADLVEHLLSNGCQACVGIDLACANAQNTIRSDWFEIPLRSSSWGTIVAHHSFSLHFLNAHHDRSKDSEKFALRFMEILRALKPGGSFIYTPGLPFIERMLDRDFWMVESRPVMPLASAGIADPYAIEQVPTASRITRLAA